MLTTASPKIFVGRNEILETLNKRVESLKSGYRQNLALTGQKLCGKTSILQNFLSTLNSDSIVPVYIEVIAEPLETFSKKFIGTMLFNFLKGSEEYIKEDLNFLIFKAEGTIPKTASAIKEVLALLDKGDLQEAYSNLFNLTSVLKLETGKSCIIILDEFHNLSSVNLKNPFAVFGKRIMVQKDTMYVVTSSQVSTIKRILKEKLDLLFGNFEIIEIKDFDYGVAKAFLEKRLEGIRVQEELKDFLISFTDSRPYYLDAIAAELNSLAAQLQFKWLATGHISQALENLFFDSKGSINQYFQNLIAGFSQGSYANEYLSILTAISEGKKRLSQIRSAFSGKKNELGPRMERLIEENFIAKNGMMHYFNDKVFEFWLKHVYNKKRYSLLSNFQDRANMFRREIEDMIALFLSENKKDIATRLKELIASFNNEVLKIGEKSLKLPKFENFKTEGQICESGILSVRAEYGGKKFWVFNFSPQPVDEPGMSRVIERITAMKLAPQRNVFIAFAGIDANAMLIAKENKVWVLGKEDLNLLMPLFNKFKILKYP